MYGGWDRDVMQGDVAQNGPNPGDRLLDWTGAYNLYTHCNSAYGGFNDVRQHSPDMQQFLQQLTYADGAGQVAAGGPMASDTLTAGNLGVPGARLRVPERQQRTRSVARRSRRRPATSTTRRAQTKQLRKGAGWQRLPSGPFFAVRVSTRFLRERPWGPPTDLRRNV